MFLQASELQHPGLANKPRIGLVSGPRQPCSSPHMVTMMGSVPSYDLHGSVCVVTGGSRGLGKGIALELAAAGGIVYLTGRSTATQKAEVLLAGSVDETAAQASRRGGQGVASYVDHTLDYEGRQFVDLIAKNHGRIDILVNNAFLLSKPDSLFFGKPVWQQPCRFFDEQFCVGARNHVFLTMLCRPLMTGPGATIVNVSSGGSQGNTTVFPIAYHVNKACYDRMMAALSHQLQKKTSICMLTLWPGTVSTERMVVGKRHFAGWLTDPETTEFTGRAVVALSRLSAEARLRLSGRTISSAEVLFMTGGHDVDGYRHDMYKETMFSAALCTPSHVAPTTRVQTVA
mmetsp:Transcript_74227/g.133805  ORF Transcript_74227/g.133805 Transcript_74227/m.133805 type:complete len:344 (+) Transcript_74227:93-1124(+)